MRSTSRFLVAVALIASGCGSEIQREPADPSDIEASSQPEHTLRLESPHFVPSEYDLRLRLDPTNKEFSGTVTIVGSIARKTDAFYLNGKDLKVQKAVIDTPEGSQDLQVVPEDEHFTLFRSARPLNVGAATVRIDYTGAVSTDESFGIFRQDSEKQPFLFTQFESRGARRAFPSVDQPDIKVPFSLTIEAPKGQLALANTPEISRHDIEGGLTRFTFAKSKPLPSYLVAFAVGPFEMVEVGKSRSGVPVRVAIPKGRADETRWVREATLPLLAGLEDYLGSPYPFAKLDLVSIPSTGSFGAMENPGLITYSESLLLSKNETTGFRRAYAFVAAHEMAHQWFGNLVTSAWWDDIWLNEAFATWAQSKAVFAWQKDWRNDENWIAKRSDAMSADRLAHARMIHQPIEDEGDIGNAFDGITYAKGASVITMFEHWLGEETFQKAIQHYLQKHQWQAATSEQFLAAIDEVTEQAVTAPFQSFLSQAGTPELSFDVHCDADKAPAVVVSQKRYLPRGSKGDASQLYKVPLCIRYAGQDGPVRECTLVEGASIEVPLAQAQSCPKWIIPNAGYTGYYRSTLSPEWIGKLRNAPLTSSERLGLIDDLRASVDSGSIKLEELLAFVPSLARDKDDQMVTLAASVANLGKLVQDSDRARYSKWIADLFGKRAKALGWKIRKGEAQETRILRTTLLSLMANEAGDAATIAQARKLAAQWLKAPESVDPDLAATALGIAARYGDAALFDTLVAKLDSLVNRGERQMLFSTLGRFDDPAVFDKAVALMATPRYDYRELRRLLEGTAGHHKNGGRVLDFLIAKEALLKKAVPESMRLRLARGVVPVCDKEGLEKARGFLDRVIKPVDGGVRTTDLTIEKIELCIAHREAVKLPAKLPRK
jgi:alanyl aminopeptidase